MREPLIEVLDDDARVIQNQVSIDQCWHRVIRIEIQEIFREVWPINIGYFDIDIFFRQHQACAVTVNARRFRKQSHYGSSIGNYCHDAVPFGKNACCAN